jgi:hypothetical protein
MEEANRQDRAKRKQGVGRGYDTYIEEKREVE